MERTKHNLIGLMAVMPALVWAVVLYFENFARIPDEFLVNLPYAETWLSPFLSYWYITFIGLNVIIFLFFLAHAKLSKAVPSDKKYLWLAVILFGDVLAYPFYWWHYVRQPKAA